jgi:hypothetical protein
MRRLNCKFFYKKNGNHQYAKRKRGRKTPTGLSQRNRKACHSIGTALLQSIAKIRAHEEQQKDVTGIHAAHPLKPVEREQKWTDGRTNCCMRT